MFESSPWSALFVVLLAAPVWAQEGAVAAPAAVAQPTPVVVQPVVPVPVPVQAEAGPIVVQNPYPPAPIVSMRLPPPRLYAVQPRDRGPRRYGREGAPFSLGIGPGFRFRNDVGYRRLGAERRQVELDLFASYDLLQAGPKLVIAAGVGYRLGEVGKENELLVTSHAVSAEVIARYKLTSWLVPHVRAGAGVLTSRLELADDAVEIRLKDRENSALGVLGAGVTWRTPSRLFETYAGRLSSLSVGVLVEGGYALCSAASFRARPAGDSEVAQSAVALGKLPQAGAFLRFLAVVRL